MLYLKIYVQQYRSSHQFTRPKTAAKFVIFIDCYLKSRHRVLCLINDHLLTFENQFSLTESNEFLIVSLVCSSSLLNCSAMLDWLLSLDSS